MDIVVNMVAMLTPRRNPLLAWAWAAILLSYPMKIQFLVGIVAMSTARDVLAMAQSREAPLDLLLEASALLFPPLI